EKELIERVTELKERNRLFGDVPNVEDLVNPPVEEEYPDECPFEFNGDLDIVEKVQHEMAVQHGEVIEIDSDDEDEEADSEPIGSKAIVELCAQMEAVCLQRVAEDDDSLQLMSLLRRLRGRVHREEMLNAKQTTLDSFFQKV
ncbi:hypothetical protein EUX98_g9765, partial [Antrodiella citrinella]